MPVEIKQIVIRAVLTDKESPGKPSEAPEMEKESIVQECVDQILKILKKKNRR